MKVMAIDKSTQKLIDKRVQTILKNLIPEYQTVFTAAACVALNEEFGFGRDRLCRFIKTLEQYCMENLESYVADDVVREKVQRDMELLGLK